MIKRTTLQLLFLVTISLSVKTEEQKSKVTFDIITTFEGKIDPKNPPRISTHIRANEKKYTIITPKFENTQGFVKYHTSLSTEVHPDGTVSYTGSAKSNVLGDGNVGIHVQRFDADNYEENKKAYKKFANFIYDYLNFILQKNETVNIDVIKDLYNSYVYFGSLARGENPGNEVLFQETLAANSDDADYKAISSAKTKGSNDNSFNYAVTNLNNQKTGNNFQHNFSVTKGETPGSILHIKTKGRNEIQKSDMKSFLNAQKSKIDPLSFSNVLSGGKTSEFGFSEQKSLSLVDGNKIQALGEGKTVSLSKEYYFKEM